MKKLIAKTALVSMLISSAQAGAIIDVEVGGGIWATGAPTGAMTASGSEIDFANTANLSSSSNAYIWAVIDHPIPVIPNIRIEQTTLKSSGTKTDTFNIPNVITLTGQLNTELDMSHTDFIAYWGVPFSTWLPFIDEFDIGLGAKVFDGSISISDAAGVVDPYNKSFAGAPMPYGYVKLRVQPPLLMGVGFEAELKYLSIDVGSALSSNFNETIVKVDWGIVAPIPVVDVEAGVEVGYRRMSFDVDASALEANMDFSGIFFGLYGKFGI